MLCAALLDGQTSQAKNSSWPTAQPPKMAKHRLYLLVGGFNA